ncbi:RHS repeat domain-containing protein [Xenorhabdus stockiae]|uniref:RHS repeat domain-containing protein n=1 Tax=Xenorhabdus stockiae TaxID=351614 RepID=UPI003CF4AC09
MDEESGLVYNRFRYYSPVTSCYLTPDPLGLMGGVNHYSYVHNPTGWSDPLGLSSKKCQEVYRELTPDDALRLEQGLSLVPKGVGGSIAAHVEGINTGHISAALSARAAERYTSGNGLIAIDVKKAVKLGASYIDHNNVMQAVMRAGSLEARKNAKIAEEVLFKGEIPFEAIKILKK